MRDCTIVDARPIGELFDCDYSDWKRQDNGVWIRDRSLTFPIDATIKWVAPETMKTETTVRELGGSVIVETCKSVEKTSVTTKSTAKFYDRYIDSRGLKLGKREYSSPPDKEKHVGRLIGLASSGYGIRRPEHKPQVGDWGNYEIIDPIRTPHFSLILQKGRRDELEEGHYWVVSYMVDIFECYVDSLSKLLESQRTS